MKLIHIAKCALLSLVIPAGVCHGENLMEVYEIAVKNDPTYKVAHAQYQASRFGILKVIATMLPGIEGNASTTGIHSELSGGYNQQSYSLSLTQALFRAEQWIQLSTADFSEQQALANYEVEFQNLLIRVSERYFSVLGAKDDLAFAKGQRKAFARQREQTQQRFDVGLIAITGVHEAKAREDSAFAREVAAKNEVANQLEKLSEITRSPILDIPTMDQDQKIPLQTPEPNRIEEWVSVANQQNLDIKVAQLGSCIAKRDIQNQAAGFLPTVDFSAQTQRASSAPPFDELTTTSSMTLSAKVPLFEGGGTIYRTLEARKRYDEALSRLDLARSQTLSATRQAYRGVLTRISEVDSLTQAVVSNESALRATRAAYDVGTRTIVDVLDAESNLLAAERDFAKARYQYILEGLRLKRSAGTLDGHDILATWQVISQNA